MFIKNPNRKEPYTFRVNPELLENIKNYAKATNTTVPELLNEMIEEKTKGLFLTDDYLTEKEVFIQNKGILGLPTLEEMYNEGKYKEFDLLDYNKKGYLVEMERVPNNLDWWDDKKGYTCTKRGYDHEGIDFVLIPDFILSIKDFENEDLLKCCLVPIYFKIPSKDSKPVEITNISFDTAISKIRNTQKIELLDKARGNELAVSEIIHSYTNMVKNATQKGEYYYCKGTVYNGKEEMVNDLKGLLFNDLYELSKDINKNIIPQQYGAFKRQKQSIGTDLDSLIPTNEKDNTIADLMEANKVLMKMLTETQNRSNMLEERANSLENEINTLKDITDKYQLIFNDIDNEKLEKLKEIL